ncbi:MAG: DinB family protein [Gemmatimonadaceae bacterium]
MQLRLREVLDYTEQARADLLALIEPLDAERWEARASSGGWSVREVVAHLHLVEASSVRALFRSFRTARDAGLGAESEATSLLALLDWSRLSETVRPQSAPDFITPREDVPAGELVKRLAVAREGLRKFSVEADGFALAEVHFPHPALGSINLYQWVLMIGQHERRHIGQIRRILEERAT